MRFIAPFLIALSLHATALPTLDPFLEDRDVSCTGDPSIPYEASCYGTLGISAWLQNWNQTTQRCSSAQNGSNCCGLSGNPNEPWSTCFLRLSLGNADYDCSQINIKSCSLEGAQLAKGINDTAQTRYVVRNLFAINSFFTDWYTALQYATSQAALAVTPIITMIDPPTNTNMALNDVLTALTAGLAIIAAPEIGPALEGAAAVAASAFSSAIQQAPGVAKAIWPSGTANSETVQIGDLQTQLGSVSSNLSDRLQSGLSMLMSDVGAFTSFASQGSFSGYVIPSLPNETEALNIGLKTFILTTAMDHNEWSVYWGPSFTDGLVNTVESQATNFGCTIESNGVCDTPNGKGTNGQPQGWAEWTSNVTNRSFSTQKYFAKGSSGPSGSAVMSAITNNQWGTLPLVFDSSYNCSQTHPPLGRTPVISTNGDGTLDFSCLGQLQTNSGCGDENTPWGVAKGTKSCTPFFGVD